MSIVELIGFGISILALIFLYFKNQQAISTRQEHLETLEEEEEPAEEDPLQALMFAMQKEKKEKPVVKPRPSPTKLQPPLPPPLQQQKPVQPPLQPIHKSKHMVVKSSLEDYRLASVVEKRKVKSALEERHLKSQLTHRYEEISSIAPARPQHVEEHHKSYRPARIQVVMKRLTHLPDFVIYQEVLSRPKSLRTDQWP